MDAVSSLCGPLVVHVYGMPQESLIKERERERGGGPVQSYRTLCSLMNKTYFTHEKIQSGNTGQIFVDSDGMLQAKSHWGCQVEMHEWIRNTIAHPYSQPELLYIYAFSSGHSNNPRWSELFGQLHSLSCELHTRGKLKAGQFSDVCENTSGSRV